MDVEEIYCPGCHHRIRLTRTTDHLEGHASLPEGAEVVCLDFGGGCSDGRCPVTGTPGIVMGVRLARSGLRERPFHAVAAHCEGCGQVTELQVLDDTYAVCPLCGTTNRCVMLDLDDDTRVRITLR